MFTKITRKNFRVSMKASHCKSEIQIIAWGIFDEKQSRLKTNGKRFEIPFFSSLTDGHLISKFDTRLLKKSTCAINLAAV